MHEKYIENVTLKGLTHSFLPQNSPFLGSEVIVFFMGTYRLDGNPCFFYKFMLKK